MANSNSTQQHLKIASIEEGVLILKNGAISVVLKIEPINFDLKNELEQNSIVAKYQGFLNGLDYPVQIVIRSKRLDLQPYLDELENRTKNQMNELLQIQSSDYISFMRSLVDIANIMSKEYYAVISYHRSNAKSSTGILSVFNKSSTPKISRSEFERLRNELNSRANTVASGLSQLGLKVNALNTQQLIELFYGLYNPDISSTERLVEVKNIQADVITKAEDTVQTQASVEQPKVNDSIIINPEEQDIAKAVGAAEVPVDLVAKQSVATEQTAPPVQPVPEQPTTEQPTTEGPVTEQPLPTEQSDQPVNQPNQQ